jgi:hypothetical protein
MRKLNDVDRYAITRYQPEVDKEIPYTCVECGQRDIDAKMHCFLPYNNHGVMYKKYYGARHKDCVFNK